MLDFKFNPISANYCAHTRHDVTRAAVGTRTGKLIKNSP